MHWRRWLSHAVVACALMTGGVLGCGPAAPASAIAHGRDAQDGEYPFSTKLTMTGIPDGNGGRRDSSCSGGLIAERWVLTAGHCFKDARGRHVSRPVARKTIATVGRADLTGTRGAQATVIEVHQSPVADVALAELDRRITGITPMRLNRKAPRVGQQVRLTGFGLLDGADTEVTDRMQVGEFTVTSVGRYELGMAGTAPRTDTSACEHDSGGPYFVPGGGSAVVVGVVSYGPDCPHPGAERSGRIDTVASWALGIIGHDGPVPAAKSSGTPKTSGTGKSKAGSPKAPPATALADSGNPIGELGPPVVAGAGVLAAAVAVFGATRRRGRRRPRHRRRAG